MNANQMKHDANLAAWKQRIMECRASGQPVKKWCEDNNCNPSTYYRWEREIFGRIKKPPGERLEITPASEMLLPDPRHDLVELPLVESAIVSPASVVQPSFCPVAVIRIGSMELSLANAVSAKLLRQIKELLPDAE